MLQRKRMRALIVALALALCLCVPTLAWAWSTDTEGNSPTENSQEESGTTAGTTNIQGWIGTFDGTEDPDRPDPPEDAWINVKIPTKALFGSLSDDDGVIYSPKYYIYNYSVKAVEVTPDSFTPKETEHADLSNMKLDLNFTSPTTAEIPLRKVSGEFLGNDFPSAGSITIAKKDSSEYTQAEFIISGNLGTGFIYPPTTPIKPVYELIFVFKAIDVG